MKNIIFALALTVFLGTIFQPTCYAQKSSKEIKKEMKKRANKDARKQAKKYKKEGYRVNPGALPMDKQLEKAWIKEYEEDDLGFPKYIVSPGQAVGQTQTAAKIQAIEMAKLELAGKIQTQVAALIENSVGNQQLNNEDATSVTQTIASSKSLIAQEIGRTITLFEMYKNIKKNVEVRVRIAYNAEMAIESAKKIIRKELEEKTEIAHEKIEKMMDF
ncbi:MAG: hypothetical protein U9R32_04920 [Bacteroidota bacterium]|nr:hypothetical protein [Bacteroidota bacterium]